MFCSNVNANDANFISVSSPMWKHLLIAQLSRSFSPAILRDFWAETESLDCTNMPYGSCRKQIDNASYRVTKLMVIFFELST